MSQIQQKIFLPLNDTVTFTSIESTPAGEKKSTTGPTRRVPNRTLKQPFCGYLMTEILLPFIHQADKVDKYRMNCTGLEKQGNLKFVTFCLDIRYLNALSDRFFKRLLVKYTT